MARPQWWPGRFAAPLLFIGRSGRAGPSHDPFRNHIDGHSLASRCRTVDVVQFLWEALSARFPDAGLVIGRDNGSQFTPEGFLREVAALDF